MTYSILVRDPETGAMAGAAATGNLAVGGWVLRGSHRAGLSASQGHAPSRFWGEDVLAAMAVGAGAEDAVRKVTEADAGRNARQLAALDRQGRTFCFDGAANRSWCGHIVAQDLVAAGNWLSSEAVLSTLVDAYLAGSGPLGERLIGAIAAGQRAGSDARGTLSAALLVLDPASAALDLRVDYDPDPIGALARLYERTRKPEYQEWTRTVPTFNDPQRAAGAKRKR